MHWNKLTHKQIKERVFSALKQNLNYGSEAILGIPATYLDEEEFYKDAPFLADAPYISALIANPNHIGCHTLTGDHSLSVFRGTQQIEIELISLCAEQIFKGEKNQQDGYVASGGTEANIQAMWIYRNYFVKEFEANYSEIALVCSEDSHYSASKGVNLLGIQSVVCKVNEHNRSILMPDLEQKINQALKEGVKYFILFINMSTTMFGSVDDLDGIAEFFEQKKLEHKIHIDGAFGGFIYPFTNQESTMNFANPRVTSITFDGHKMLQTPYGTGIFVVRKGYMQYVVNKDAQYIPGLDYTLVGSRSGANAISIWMILMRYGSEGWKFKMESLIDRTQRITEILDDFGVQYYNNPFVNIVSIRAKYITKDLADKYHLVADTYSGDVKWYKIVIMTHVKQGLIDCFISDLKAQLR